MITLQDIELENAYKDQGFIVPIFLEKEGLRFEFNVELKDTYAKGYSLDLMFEDDVDEEIFDGVEPKGFFSSTELKAFEKVIFGKELKDELFKQKKGAKRK